MNDAMRAVEAQSIEQANHPHDLDAQAAHAMAREHIAVLRAITEPAERQKVAVNMDGIAERHDNYRAEIAKDPDIAAEVISAGIKARADRDKQDAAGAAHIAQPDVAAVTPVPAEPAREGWVLISPEDALFLEASKGIHVLIRQERLDKEAAIEAMPGAQDGMWTAEQVAAVQPLSTEESFWAARSQRAQEQAEADAKAKREQDALASANAAEVARLAQVGPLTDEQAFAEARAERAAEADKAMQDLEAVAISDAKLLHSIAGSAHILMSAPAGVEEARQFVAGDLEALGQIRIAELRTRALQIIDNTCAAQEQYRLELERLAPDIARQAAAAGEAGHRREVQAAIDQEALGQVAAQRARDRADAGKGLGLNTIERGGSWASDPAQTIPAQPIPTQTEKAVATSRPKWSEVIQTHVPPEVERAYHREGKKFYMPKNRNHLAFEDHGNKLETSMTASSITLSMVQIAQARGWSDIKVRGTEEFCRQAWREAALRGIAVQGYTPNEMDLADLARRMPKTNTVVLDKPAAPSAPPGRTGDVLVAHGAAPYQHDADNPDSYFVTVENPQGKQRTTWGVNLGKAIAESGAKVGDQITLTKNGQKQVEVDTVDKDAAGKVVGTRKIGAIRNEWKIKAQALNTQPPEQAVKTHPELAGAIAIAAAIDKRAAADGYTPAQRAIIAARVSHNVTNTIERGTMPVVQLREAVEVRQEVQQEQSP